MEALNEQNRVNYFHGKSKTSVIFTPSSVSPVGISPKVAQKTPGTVATFKDFRVLRTTGFNNEKLADAMVDHKGGTGMGDSKLRYAKLVPLFPHRENTSPSLHKYKMYDEKDLTALLKGRVKRVCNFFQNEIVKKEHAEALKAIIAKNKAQAKQKTREYDTPFTTAAPQAVPNADIKGMINHNEKVAIELTDLARYFCGYRLNSHMPLSHEDSTRYLDKEGVSYNNVLMMMVSNIPELPTRQIFNWKSAMKQMCSGNSDTETQHLEMLDKEDTFRIYIPLPFKPSMKDFLRNCGFVIDENCMPVMDNDDVMQYDAVHFYVFPPFGKQEEPQEAKVDIKTGTIEPQTSQDPESVMVYDICMTKVPTDPDHAADGDDDFEKAISSDTTYFPDPEELGVDKFTEDIFSFLDPENLYTVIGYLRKLMPEECEGMDLDLVELPSQMYEKNAENFAWFLNQMDNLDSSTSGRGGSVADDVIGDTEELPMPNPE